MSISLISSGGSSNTTVSTTPYLNTTYTLDLGVNVGDVVVIMPQFAGTSAYPVPSGWSDYGSSGAAWIYVVPSGVSSVGSVTLPGDSSQYIVALFRSTLGTIVVGNMLTTTYSNGGSTAVIASGPLASTATLLFIYNWYTPNGYSLSPYDTYTSSPSITLSAIYSIGNALNYPGMGYADLSGATTITWNNTTGATTYGISIEGFLLTEGSTPAAPTLLTPTNATYEDLSGASTYTWTYNNTDGSTQAAYAFRNKIAGGSTYSYYNASTNALQTSEVWNASTTGTATLGAGLLSNGNQYNWSVATQSNYGLQGPFASDFTAVGQAAPTVTLTAPTGTITSNTVEVAWSPVFPSGAYQTAYQIWVYDLATTQATGFTVGQTTGLISGSGVVASNAVSATVGTLPNFTTCVFYVQLTETGNELSAIVSTTATVNFTPPVAPTVVATPTTDANGTPIIQVTVTGHDNLFSANDASFEGGVGSWTARVNSTIAQSSAKALQGSYSLEATSTAAGAFSVQAGTYPVTAGSSYSALLSSLAAATPEVFSLNIDWLDVNSNVLSTSTGSSATDSTTAWTEVTVTGVAPTNAVSAKMWVYYGNSTASEVHYIDAAGLFEASTPPTWSPGGFVGGTTTTVTRSDGFVLRTTPTLNSTTQQATLSDYEWTSGTAYTYTAVVEYSLGSTLLTSASSTSSATTQSTTAWWLINPITPTSAFAPFVKSFTMLQLEQGASHTQIGQALPTIVSSVMGGKDGQLTVQTSTAAEWTTLQNLINSRATLWLTNYLGDGLYVRVGPSPGGMSSGTGLSSKQAQLAPSLASNPVRTIQLSYQQVAQP